MKVIKKLKVNIYKRYPWLKLLVTMLSAIEKVNVDNDGSIYMKMRKHVIIETTGSVITYTKNGYHVSMAKQTHINPDIDLNYFNSYHGVKDLDISTNRLTNHCWERAKLIQKEKEK